MTSVNINKLTPLKGKLPVISRFFKKQFIGKGGYALVCMDHRRKGVPTLGFPRLVAFHRWYYCYCHGLKAKDIRGDQIHHIGPKLDNRRHKLTLVTNEQHRLLEYGKRRAVNGFH